MVCALLEMHHWTLTDIYAMDVEKVMEYIGYYPHWAKQLANEKSSGESVERVYADQVNL